MSASGYVVLIALVMLCIISTGAFFWTAHLRVQEFAIANRKTQVDHAHCVAHVAHYVGDHFAAQVLRLAAEDLDSVEGQTELRTLSRGTGYSPLGGKSLMRLWLEDRAEALTWAEHTNEEEGSA